MHLRGARLICNSICSILITCLCWFFSITSTSPSTCVFVTSPRLILEEGWIYLDLRYEAGSKCASISLPADVHMRCPSIHQLGFLNINRTDLGWNKFKPWKLVYSGTLHMTKSYACCACKNQESGSQETPNFSPRSSHSNNPLILHSNSPSSIDRHLSTSYSFSTLITQLLSRVYSKVQEDYLWSTTEYTGRYSFCPYASGSFQYTAKSPQHSLSFTYNFSLHTNLVKIPQTPFCHTLFGGYRVSNYGQSFPETHSLDWNPSPTSSYFTRLTFLVCKFGSVNLAPASQCCED